MCSPSPSACVRRRNARSGGEVAETWPSKIKKQLTRKLKENQRKPQRLEHRKHNEPLAKLQKPCFKTRFNNRSELTSASTRTSHAGKILQMNDGQRDDSRRTTTTNGSEGRQIARGKVLRTKPAERSTNGDETSEMIDVDNADKQQKQHETNSSQHEHNWYSSQMPITESLQNARPQDAAVYAEAETSVHLSTVITKTQAVFPLSNKSNRFSATGRQIDSSDGRGFESAISHFRQSTVNCDAKSFLYPSPCVYPCPCVPSVYGTK